MDTPSRTHPCSSALGHTCSPPNGWDLIAAVEDTMRARVDAIRNGRRSGAELWAAAAINDYTARRASLWFDHVAHFPFLTPPAGLGDLDAVRTPWPVLLMQLAKDIEHQSEIEAQQADQFLEPDPCDHVNMVLADDQPDGVVCEDCDAWIGTVNELL